MKTVFLLISTFAISWRYADALNVVLAGGTGSIGSKLASRLSNHEVTILARNAFLAAAPSRVTEDFGWVGANFMKKNPHVRLRDWDGGDLLDIVGQDWLGWQDDVLKPADVVVNLVGGFTEQRVMACERLVRESLSLNKDALQITVSPTEEDLPNFSPGAQALKKERIKLCEDMVKSNCVNAICLRIESNHEDTGCDRIQAAIEDWREQV